MCLFPKKTHLLNKHTSEIHDMEASKKNCRINLMATRNKQRITAKRASQLIADGQADGCRWCMPKQNKG